MTPSPPNLDRSVTQISAFSNQNVVHNVEQCRLLPASAPAPDLQQGLRPPRTRSMAPAPSLTSAAAIAAMRAVDSWPTSPALMS